MNATELTSEQIADALGMRVNGSRWHKVVDPSELSFDIAAVSDFCTAGCSRDHCTPEERAVIDLFVIWYEAEVNDPRKWQIHYKKACEALEHLLATRAKMKEMK